MAVNERAPLKLALLVEGTHASKYALELAAWARGRADLAVTHLILQARESTGRADPATAAFEKLRDAERRRLRRAGAHRDHFDRFDLSALVPAALPAADLARIRALALDVIVHCAPGEPDAALLDASRLGVLAFEQGDGRGPAGFRECRSGLPRTGFAIRRCTGAAEGDEILVRGYFATRAYFALNQATLHAKALWHLKRLLQQIAAQGALPPAQSRIPPGREVPAAGECAAYLCRTTAHRAWRKLTEWLRLREEWGISVLPSAWPQLLLRRAQPLRAPRGHYWADPFLLRRDGRTWCFVEDWVNAAGKGRISVLEIDGKRAVDRGVALEEPFHLSFPFLFEHQGALYLCPESMGARQIRVYRCEEFPLKWRLASILMDGVSAADTMLFERGGRWWMLTSIDPSGMGDHCSELYLFSSGSPLAREWIPHPQNPVCLDSWGGRNAGLLTDGGRIFRAAQCQGFDRYGESLVVNEILEISETRYAEQRVARIQPRFHAGLLGTHHLSSDGHVTVIDHQSYAFLR